MSNQREAMQLIKKNVGLEENQKESLLKELMQFAMFAAMGATSNSKSTVGYVGFVNNKLKELENK